LLRFTLQIDCDAILVYKDLLILGDKEVFVNKLNASEQGMCDLYIEEVNYSINFGRY